MGNAVQNAAEASVLLEAFCQQPGGSLTALAHCRPPGQGRSAETVDCSYLSIRGGQYAEQVYLLLMQQKH